MAWLFAGQFADLFKNMVSEPELRQVLAFVLIFVAVFIGGLIVSWLIHKYFPLKRGFRIVNTVLGGLIGAVRGAIIVIVVFLAAGLTAFPQRDWWRQSSFTPYFERAAVYVSSYIPRDIARHIRYG
ncbi:MAG: CvpA family protein [Gammaproteobacteria bacterium]|nr:CvpA family protein [Gammaproteobacteria bacterium]